MKMFKIVIVDSVDQDHTAQNMQSDLGSTLSTFFKLDSLFTKGQNFCIGQIESICRRQHKCD